MIMSKAKSSQKVSASAPHVHRRLAFALAGLSSGTTFVSAQANKGRFTARPVGQTGTVTWYIGTVSNDEQDAAQIKVTVIIRGKAMITNTATVNSDAQDPNPVNNSTSLSTTVERSSGGGKK
jgi:Domain of unknown function DUF11